MFVYYSEGPLCIGAVPSDKCRFFVFDWGIGMLAVFVIVGFKSSFGPLGEFDFFKQSIRFGCVITSSG